MLHNFKSEPFLIEVSEHSDQLVFLNVKCDLNVCADGVHKNAFAVAVLDDKLISFEEAVGFKIAVHSLL